MLSILGLCGNRPWRAVRLRRWDNLAKEIFAQARERGEVFHLWGHSREIEAHNDWQRLEDFLAWLGGQDIVSVCNADVPIQPPRLLVTAPYFKPRSGGLEEYTYQIAKGLQDNRKWQVAVVASGSSGGVATGKYQGLKVYHLPYMAVDFQYAVRVRLEPGAQAYYRGGAPRYYRGACPGSRHDRYYGGPGGEDTFRRHLSSRQHGKRTRLAGCAHSLLRSPDPAAGLAPGAPDHLLFALRAGLPADGPLRREVDGHQPGR